MAEAEWTKNLRTRLGRVEIGLVAVVVIAVAAAMLPLGSNVASASLRMESVHGNEAPVPPGATPIGPAPAGTSLPLVVTMQPRDPSALSAEAQSVSDPRSPEYRQFLSPAQFARQFGPTPSTIHSVTAALEQEGLTVGPPSATGLSLPVSGTAAQIESAFATPITKYRLSSGRTGYHNDFPPMVPASIAPQIEGVLGLDTLTPPQPTNTVPQIVPGRTAQGPLVSAPTLAPGQPSPQSGNCATSISTVQAGGALDAVDLAHAYSFDSLYSANHYGSGTTVALVEMFGAGYSTSDITKFANCYGITLGVGQVAQRKMGNGGATGGGTIEAELDIDTVLSLAPSAGIEVYEGGSTNSLYDVFNQIVSDDTAKIVSASWTNGCEAYVGKTMQSSENTLFQAAAVEGQSIFVASGDQGSEGCNLNGQIAASTGTTPVAQAVDPSTGTLYIVNQPLIGAGTVSVDGEGSGNDGNFTAPGSVTTGSVPDAIALDAGAAKVFVANKASSTLTVFSTTACNQAHTSGCGSTTTIAASSGHLVSPQALAVSGSTLYVGNGDGTVAIYNAATNAFVTMLTLPPLSAPTALAMDTTNGFLYLADGLNNRIEYLDTTNCNAGSASGCATPVPVTVGNDPVALVVDAAVGDLYVANAGSGGGVSVVSLSSHAITTTISTGSPPVAGIDGTGVVQSIGLSPDGQKVLAVLHGLAFPGDVMATIDPSSNAITATVDLQTGADTMGQLASDASRDYVWVTDESGGFDILQNLNLAVTDPAAQPDVTSVGGTTISGLGPPPGESTWNNQLKYAEGAGGGGISQTFAMPSSQRAIGVVVGSSGTPCSNASGDCREVPDVSADADPQTGYIVYDAANGYNWVAVGGTSGAAPLWAAVVAVAASSKGVTTGFGNLNPVLYNLAQLSPGTYVNDVTSGNDDFNATNGVQYPAMVGYDMATGLGSPVASQLSAGLTTIFVAVSGSQTYGGAPSFSGSDSPPAGIAVNTAGLSCTTVGSSTPITPTLSAGPYTLTTASCSGATLSGANAANYGVAYTSAVNDFTVHPAPLNVAVSGSQTYGGAPSFNGSDSPPAGITVDSTGLSCTTVGSSMPITPTLGAGSYTVTPASCSGATLSGANAANYGVAYTSAANDFTVSPAPLTVTASSGAMTYGGTVPTVTPAYTGFKNGDTPSSLTTPPACATVATPTSPVSGSPYVNSCGGAVDPNYTFMYQGGFVTVSPAPLTVTASSGAMTYGTTVPTITPLYAGFKNGDSSGNLTTPPTCSTVATPTSSVSGSPYLSSCSGGADSNYTFSYLNGSVTVSPAPVNVAVSGSQTYGGAPSFSGSDSPPAGITVDSTGLSCTTVGSSMPITPTLGAGSYTVTPASCSGATLSAANAANYGVAYTSAANDFTVSPAPLTVTASSGAMTYGGTVPTVTPAYTGFKNGDTPSSLTTPPACATVATPTSPVSGSPYVNSCGGAVDPNYTFMYQGGFVTVSPAPLTVTASSGAMTYGTTVPTITPLYAGFKNGDSSGNLTTPPTCSTVATPTSSVSGSPYLSSCSGGADSNYTFSYLNGSVTVSPAPVNVAVSGSQTYGGAPSFSGSDSPPAGITVDSTGLSCTTVGSSMPITPTLGAGSYTVTPASCSGATLSGANAANYGVAYTSAANDFTVTGGPPPPPPPPSHGYWLVGSDGGIFTFGSAVFYGSTGSIRLQRPVVGITPTRDEGGYWLVASDGGIFSFGDSGFYGSIPGLGLHPAGSGLPGSLNAPIVGMVPSADGGGYFMVASDGGVFAFGDARFEGSCPGMGGCQGPAVAVLPDASGAGYWLVTASGHVYTFGDAPYFGAPGPQGSPVTSAVRTPDGRGYYVLLANGSVYPFGDARSLGGPTGSVGGLDPASAIFTDTGGGGYWVASASGDVYTYGDAPNAGSMAGTRLNGSIVAATGF